MVLQNERMSIRTWTFHDDELLDDWPPYNDPTEPLWNLPRRAAYGGDQWGQFFDGSGMRRTWAVEDRSGRLIGRISAETGARVGGTLYSDSLTGEKGDSPTYIAMVRHNIKALTSALSP